MMRRLLLVVSSFTLFTAGLSAQNGTGGVFAPFVSRLTAFAQENRIVLSWKNSEDLNGYKRIFRADAEITEQTIGSAVMIARVTPDAESYNDAPSPGRDYFYAVFVEDRNGDPYRIFIPYRNKTVAGVRLTETAAAAAAAVTGISAAVTGDAIMVSFLPSNRSRDLIFYRSTSPLRSFADLTKASYSILLSPGTLQVKDVPLPGVDYYYAVLDAGLVNSGKVQFTAGQNATAAPIQIPLGDPAAARRDGPGRVYPLPAPHVLYSIDSGEELLPPLPFLLPRETELSPAVRNRVDPLVDRIHRPPRTMTFEVLPVDEAPNPEGEELLLQSIVKDVSTAPDARESAVKIEEFLRTAHGDLLEARARFYLGQAYYLNGRVREALLQFILSRNHYYLETQAWIDACLQSLAAKN